jgi:tetratricopeptide (TPR) repeat protein
MIRRIQVIAIAITLAWATGPSRADDSDDQAKQAFDRGVSLYQKGRYVEALAEFSAGYTRSKRPLFLFNMAECSRLSNDVVRARESYERYLREDPQGRMAELARKRLRELPAASTPPASTPPASTPPSIHSQATAATAGPHTATDLRAPERFATPPSAPPGRALRIETSTGNPASPVYTRWWFWSGVGVAVLAGTAAIYVATRQDSCAGCPVIDFSN